VLATRPPGTVETRYPCQGRARHFACWLTSPVYGQPSSPAQVAGYRHLSTISSRSGRLAVPHSDGRLPIMSLTARLSRDVDLVPTRVPGWNTNCPAKVDASGKSIRVLMRLGRCPPTHAAVAFQSTTDVQHFLRGQPRKGGETREPTAIANGAAASQGLPDCESSCCTTEKGPIAAFRYILPR
jgi:hypothetical protein